MITSFAWCHLHAISFHAMSSFSSRLLPFNHPHQSFLPSSHLHDRRTTPLLHDLHVLSSPLATSFLNRTVHLHPAHPQAVPTAPTAPSRDVLFLLHSLCPITSWPSHSPKLPVGTSPSATSPVSASHARTSPTNRLEHPVTLHVCCSKLPHCSP